MRSSTPRSTAPSRPSPDGRSHGTAVTLAEPLRRAGHRLDPTRVSRPRHRPQRTAPATTTPYVRRLLPSITDASRARQGPACSATRLRGRRGPRRRPPRSRRVASSLRTPRRLNDSVIFAHHRRCRAACTCVPSRSSDRSAVPTFDTRAPLISRQVVRRCPQCAGRSRPKGSPRAVARFWRGTTEPSRTVCSTQPVDRPQDCQAPNRR